MWHESRAFEHERATEVEKSSDDQTYLPFALCEILLDLRADRLVDVLIQGGVTGDPDRGGTTERVDVSW